jgi:adenylate cyclase
VEIERKFLVADPPELAESDSEPVEQGYLATGAGGEVRLRRIGDAHRLTVKLGAGIARDEAEIDLTREQFEALWPLTEGRRLRKRRYAIREGDAEIELDVFEGPHRGLAIAEVEFDSEPDARRFRPPTWFGDEVTGDDAYLNESLAVAGAPP